MTLLVTLTLACLLLTLCLRLIYLLMKMWSKRKEKSHSLPQATKKSVHLMTVLGSGGHTKEMLVLISSLGINFTPRSYIVAENDNFSAEKVVDQQEKMGDNNFTICKLPRSRNVHQSYLSSVYTSLKAVLYALPLIAKDRPDILILNGPGTCIPVLICTLIMNFCFVCNTKIVYIESICRVTSLSLSGQLAYYFVDSFIVQWPDLALRLPMAVYLGRLL